jgi:hypothetical protein
MSAILLVVAGYLLLTALAATSTVQGYEVARPQFLGALGVLALLLLVYWFLWGSGTTLRVVGLSWLVVGGLLAWSGGTALNYAVRQALAEPLRPSFVTPDGARLASDLVEASQARHRDPHLIATVADPAVDAALAWRLRQLKNLRWAVARDEIEDEAVILEGIAPSTAEGPAFGPAPYLGREYLVSGSFQPTFLDLGADPWMGLRWLLTREPVRDATLGGNVLFDRASLYLRVDEEVMP